MGRELSALVRSSGGVFIPSVLPGSVTALVGPFPRTSGGADLMNRTPEARMPTWLAGAPGAPSDVPRGWGWQLRFRMV